MLLMALGSKMAEIDVGMPALEKHGTIARRFPAKSMRGGVANDIRLRFHNPSTNATLREIMDQRLSNEKARQLGGVDGKLSASQPANGKRTRHKERYFTLQLPNDREFPSDAASLPPLKPV